VEPIPCSSLFVGIAGAGKSSRFHFCGRLGSGKRQFSQVSGSGESGYLAPLRIRKRHLSVVWNGFPGHQSIHHTLH
jgi:hypothetical protein